MFRKKITTQKLNDKELFNNYLRTKFSLNVDVRMPQLCLPNVTLYLSLYVKIINL